MRRMDTTSQEGYGPTRARPPEAPLQTSVLLYVFDEALDCARAIVYQVRPELPQALESS